MSKTGVQLVTYIPFNAYLSTARRPSIARLQSTARASPPVQWDGRLSRHLQDPPSSRGRLDEKGAEERRSGRITSRSRWWTIPAANAATLALIDSLKLAPILGPEPGARLSQRDRSPAARPAPRCGPSAGGGLDPALCRFPRLVRRAPEPDRGRQHRQQYCRRGRGISRGSRARDSPRSSSRPPGSPSTSRTTGSTTPRRRPIISGSTSTATRRPEPGRLCAARAAPGRARSAAASATGRLTPTSSPATTT